MHSTPNDELDDFDCGDLTKEEMDLLADEMDEIISRGEREYEQRISHRSDAATPSGSKTTI